MMTQAKNRTLVVKTAEKFEKAFGGDLDAAASAAADKESDACFLVNGDPDFWAEVRRELELWNG